MCATLAYIIHAFTFLLPRTFRVLQNSWVSKTKPNQLPKNPTRSRKAVTYKELSQFGYSQEAGG